MVRQRERQRIFLFTLGFLVVLIGFNTGIFSSMREAAAQDKKAKQPKIDVFKILIVNENATKNGIEKAYTFAGIIIDRSRRVKRNETTAEVKVTDAMPNGKNPGQPFDVIFLVRPSYVESGDILTFTSSPVNSCRGFLKTFLTKTLSGKQISKAYKGAELKPAEYLMEDLDGNGWLASCTD